MDELGAYRVYMSITTTNSHHCSEYYLSFAEYPFDFLEFLGGIFFRDCEFVFHSKDIASQNIVSQKYITSVYYVATNQLSFVIFDIRAL